MNESLTRQESRDLVANPWRRRSVAVSILLALVLVACVGWWTMHPDALEPNGNGIGSLASVGETVLIGAIVYAKAPVRIASIHPHQLTGARATYRFFACRDIALGVARGAAAEVCPEWKPGIGFKLDPQGPWQIVAEITLLQPGLSATNGFIVSYREGLRYGRQVTGVSTKVYSSEEYAR